MSHLREQSCTHLAPEAFPWIASHGCMSLVTAEGSESARSEGCFLLSLLDSVHRGWVSGQKGQTVLNKETSLHSHFVNKDVHTYRSSAGYTFDEPVILLCCRSGFVSGSGVTAALLSVRGKRLLFAFCTGPQPRRQHWCLLQPKTFEGSTC